MLQALPILWGQHWGTSAIIEAEAMLSAQGMKSTLSIFTNMFTLPKP